MNNNKGSFKRLLSYTFRYKWSFFISVLGFIMFAFADIAAVEWIRRIIGFLNEEETGLHTLLALSVNWYSFWKRAWFFCW